MAALSGIKLIQNFASLAGAEAVSKIITFAAFAYLARLFGPSEFGYVEWAGAILICASLIVDQGFSAYGAREIAKKPGRTEKLVREIVTARFFLAVGSYALVIMFALLFVNKQIIINLLLVYGLSLLVLPLIIQWVFQGHDRMQLVALAQIIRQTIFVGTVFVFVRSVNDLLFVGIAELLAVSGAALFCVLIYRLKFVKKLSLRPSFSKKLFYEGIPIGMSQMFWVAKMFGATLIVGIIATSEETGYFAAAMRIYIALHTFVWLYFANLLPSFSRSWDLDDGSFAVLLKTSMRIVVPVTAIAVIAWVWLSPVAMSIAYGQEFLSGSGALRWLAGACAAAAISGHFRYGLIAAGFQNWEMATAAFGSTLAVVMIPFGYYAWGIDGAAAVLCFTEIAILVFVSIIARRRLFNLVAASMGDDNGILEGIPRAIP